MKNRGILNPELVNAVAALGHTEYLCVADCGLPMPKGVKVVDLSLTAGIPSFLEVLRTVADELVIEGYIMAEETKEKNPSLPAAIDKILPGIPSSEVSHARFKELSVTAKCVVRTGEASPYANIILIGGVNF